MNVAIVSFTLALIFSPQVFAISPKVKYEREIQYQLDYMIRKKAEADALARSMNIARERVQVWHIQEEIKKHIQETFWFEDAIRYAAQLHFEAAGILTDRYAMAKLAEADFLPLVNSSKNQVSIATALAEGKRNMRAQELSAAAYLEWYEAHVAETLAVRDKIWGREQYGNPLYYYHDGLAIYNRAVESLFWIEDVVDDLSRTMNNHDASTIRRKKERTYRELEKEYKRRLLRAKEDRVADEKELMRIDGVAQSENIDGLVNSLTHIKGKDRAIKHILNLVKQDSVRRLTEILCNYSA